MIGMGIFYYFLFEKTSLSLVMHKFLNSPYCMISLSVCLLLIFSLLYPHQLALRAIGRGSDAENALNLVGHRLIEGISPYAHLTYLQNQIHAGPGFAILVLPFTYTGAYGILIPFLAILSAIIVMRVTKSNLNANRFLLCLLSSPAFLEELAQGNDYILMGLLFSLITVALFYYWGKNRVYNLFFIAIVGLLGTSRLPFFYLAPLLGLFIYRKNKWAGIYFGITSLFVTLSLHFGFYIWDPAHYTPLEVLGKNYAGAVTHSIAALIIVVVSCAAVGVIALLTVKNNVRSWLLTLWLCLATPLCVAGIIMLYAHWASPGSYCYFFAYITLTAPILIMWINLHRKELLQANVYFKL